MNIKDANIEFKKIEDILSDYGTKEEKIYILSYFKQKYNAELKDSLNSKETNITGNIFKGITVTVFPIVASIVTAFIKVEKFHVGDIGRMLVILFTFSMTMIGGYILSKCWQYTFIVNYINKEEKSNYILSLIDLKIKSINENIEINFSSIEEEELSE